MKCIFCGVDMSADEPHSQECQQMIARWAQGRVLPACPAPPASQDSNASATTSLSHGQEQGDCQTRQSQDELDAGLRMAQAYTLKEMAEWREWHEAYKAGKGCSFCNVVDGHAHSCPTLAPHEDHSHEGDEPVLTIDLNAASMILDRLDQMIDLQRENNSMMAALIEAMGEDGEDEDDGIPKPL